MQCNQNGSNPCFQIYPRFNTPFTCLLIHGRGHRFSHTHFQNEVSLSNRPLVYFDDKPPASLCQRLPLVRRCRFLALPTTQRVQFLHLPRQFLPAASRKSGSSFFKQSWSGSDPSSVPPLKIRRKEFFLNQIPSGLIKSKSPENFAFPDSLNHFENKA